MKKNMSHETYEDVMRYAIMLSDAVCKITDGSKWINEGTYNTIKE